jgi:serine-type D-Ala-D-Ala carboxypeptidase (penicillin-binding protein 5/6)
MKGLVMKYKFLCCFILLVIGLSPMTLAYSTSYSWSVLDSSIETSAQSSANVQNDNFLNLDAESAILIEQNSGQILYSHNIHEKLHPASVTKIMSLLLIMEALDSGKITLETQIPCSENAANMGGSQIWLDPRENLSVNDMLKAIAVVSANDCVTAMAEYLGGSTENFVKMMNEKAKELGMNDTNFVNCHGLDEDDHLTSAYDIALMSRELLTKHPQITNYTTIWTDSLRDGKSALSNTNKTIKIIMECQEKDVTAKIIEM